jgi:hypothetical protein
MTVQLEAGDKDGHVFKSSQVIQASNCNVCVSTFYSASIFLARWLQSIHQKICGIMVVSILFAVPIYEHSSARGR